MTTPPIADRLRAFREAAALSKQELATKAGLSISVVSHIEQGKKADPRASTVQALAQALGVSMEELFKPREPAKGRKKGR